MQKYFIKYYKTYFKNFKIIYINYMSFCTPLTCVVICVYPSPIAIILFNDSLQFIWILHLFTPFVAWNYKKKPNRYITTNNKSVRKR